MREIKFEAYDDVEKKMLSFTLDQLIDGCSSGASVYFHGLRSFRKNIRIFTGLIDCNGENIFEGDIIRCVSLGNVNPDLNQYRYIEVKECEDGGSWEEISHGLVNGRKRPKWEVVGNIYENPELLKNK